MQQPLNGPALQVMKFVFQPVENVTEDKKKGKNEKVKKCIRIAAGSTWEDPSLLEWESGESRACVCTPKMCSTFCAEALLFCCR